MKSDNGKITFLHKVSTEVKSNSGSIPSAYGSSTPLFVASRKILDKEFTSESFNLDGASSKIAGVVAVAEIEKEKSIVAVKKVIEQVQDHHLERVCPAIHMDAMAFGMGCCCLQLTFQNEDVDESRFIYDQLAVLAPIMMALTASTPILKGRIADTDCRWGVISESVDDRTPAERGNGAVDDMSELAGKGKRRLYKSRYDSISTYIFQGSCGSNSNQVLNKYNDIPVPIDEEMFQTLRDSGIDPALSQHIAHLFVRDPLVVFNGAIEEVNDETQTEHFESIQSTNWQSVRWKPPPPRSSPNDPHIGWRTEFRSMEMQLTDFENAAFTAFVVLLTRVILTFDLNLYLPLSRVDANMQRAHSRDAASKGKFFFRRHLAPLEVGDDGFGVEYVSIFTNAINGTDSIHTLSTNKEYQDKTVFDSGCGCNDDGFQRNVAPCATGGEEENSFEEMTMAEIMTGKGDYFPGLIPLVFAYLDYINCDDLTRQRLTDYLNFIEKRAVGKLVTPATWMRNFVRSHMAYKNDSVVSAEIA